MCGIVGILMKGQGAGVDESVLHKMVACVQHRGPDDRGFFVENGIRLGHQRLAILDLSEAGRQPMTTPDGRFTLVFNGEIYNYKELRDRYCRDVELCSTSDTEVLLHVLAQRGVGTLSELRGMFALALWDAKRQALLLARDPFGKKPLYYLEGADRFVFASEVKALLQDSLAAREADPVAVTQFFLHEYVPAPLSGWRGIRQLPMGSYARVTRERVEIQSWWTPTFQPKIPDSEENIVREFDRLLAQAVSRRLVADVPVGVLLSGGIDSTTIAWYMRREATERVHSYSVSFAEDSYSEEEQARTAAAAVGSVHHDIRFGIEEFRESLDATVELMDVPFADGSLLPTYAVSKLAREQVVVALDGDGSDELLGGYGTFDAALLAERLDWLSEDVVRWVRSAAAKLPTGFDYFTFDFKAKSFMKGLGHPLARRHQLWLGSFSSAELKGLLTPEWQRHVTDAYLAIDELADEAQGLSTTDAVSLLTIRHYLLNDILVKLDRATMFVSLEARTPFLDVDLAEFVMRLPAKYKRNKYLLKKLMRGRIPAEIVDRPKQGFALPLGHWLRGPLYGWAAEVLSAERVGRVGVVRPEAAATLLSEHKAGRIDNRKKLWTLLMFQLWYEKWIAER